MYLPIFPRVASQAPGQLYGSLSAKEVILEGVGKTLSAKRSNGPVRLIVHSQLAFSVVNLMWHFTNVF